MPKQYPKQQRDRAVRMVLDHLAEYESSSRARKAIGPKVGVGVESLRRWVLEARQPDKVCCLGEDRWAGSEPRCHR